MHLLEDADLLAELALQDARILKQLIAAVTEFVDVAIVECTETGLRLGALDASHVCMVYVELDRTAFHTYAVQEDKVLAGLNLQELARAFTQVTEEPVTMQVGSSQAYFHFEASPERTYRLPLWDEQDLAPPTGLPELALSCQLTVEAKPFHTIVTQLEKIARAVEVESTADGHLYLRTEDRLEELEAEFHLQPNVTPLWEADTSPARARYTLKYLKGMTKHLMKFEVSVRVAFGPDQPLHAWVSLGGAGTLGYLLAPRIEEG